MEPYSGIATPYETMNSCCSGKQMLRGQARIIAVRPAAALATRLPTVSCLPDTSCIVKYVGPGQKRIPLAMSGLRLVLLDRLADHPYGMVAGGGRTAASHVAIAFSPI